MQMVDILVGWLSEIEQINPGMSIHLVPFLKININKHAVNKLSQVASLSWFCSFQCFPFVRIIIMSNQIFSPEIVTNDGNMYAVASMRLKFINDWTTSKCVPNSGTCCAIIECNWLFGTFPIRFSFHFDLQWNGKKCERMEKVFTATKTSIAVVV